MAQLSMVASTKGVEVAIFAGQDCVVAAAGYLGDFQILLNIVLIRIILMEGPRLIKPLRGLLLDNLTWHRAASSAIAAQGSAVAPALVLAFEDL